VVVCAHRNQVAYACHMSKGQRKGETTLALAGEYCATQVKSGSAALCMNPHVSTIDTAACSRGSRHDVVAFLIS
jgi:hypothetical protein